MIKGIYGAKMYIFFFMLGKNMLYQKTNFSLEKSKMMNLLFISKLLKEDLYRGSNTIIKVLIINVSNFDLGKQIFLLSIDCTYWGQNTMIKEYFYEYPIWCYHIPTKMCIKSAPYLHWKSANRVFKHVFFLMFWC